MLKLQFNLLPTVSGGLCDLLPNTVGSGQSFLSPTEAL